MSAIIKSMVLRKRAAKALQAANAAAYASLVAQARGEPGMTWRGPYDPDATYVKDDVVSNKGASYIALVDDPDGGPPGVDWEVVAAAGKPGKAGAAGKTTVVQLGGGGGGNELDTLGYADPITTPDTIAVKQNGQWVQMRWIDFLAMMNTTPLVPDQVVVRGIGVTVDGEPVFVSQNVLDGQIVVNGIGVTVGGDPVFLTHPTFDDQVVVNGVGVTVNGLPVFVSSNLNPLDPNQVLVNGAGVTVDGNPVTISSTNIRLVYVEGDPVTVNNQPVEVS